MTGRHILHTLGMPGSFGASRPKAKRRQPTTGRGPVAPKATEQGSVNAGYVRWLRVHGAMGMAAIAAYLDVTYYFVYRVIELNSYPKSPATRPPQWKEVA